MTVRGRRKRCKNKPTGETRKGGQKEENEAQQTKGTRTRGTIKTIIKRKEKIYIPKVKKNRFGESRMEYKRNK